MPARPVLAALLVAAAATAADSPKADPAAELHKYLRLQPAAADKGPFKVGDPVKVTFALKNVTGRDLFPPTEKMGPAGNQRDVPTAGVVQFWIERVGRDPAIPELKARNPRATPRGRQYPAGGYVVTTPEKLEPGAEVPLTQLKSLNTIDTKNFPAGTYKFTAEFKTRDGTAVQAEAVEFTLK